jgi:Holliday junction resolvase
MTTPETKVKKAVTKILDKHGAYHFFPATHGYGRSGVPDIVACYQSKFIGIECKAGKGMPTALQLRELRLIEEAGGYSFVVREDTLALVEVVLADIDDRSKKENV